MITKIKACRYEFLVKSNVFWLLGCCFHVSSSFLLPRVSLRLMAAVTEQESVGGEEEERPQSLSYGLIGRLLPLCFPSSLRIGSDVEDKHLAF